MSPSIILSVVLIMFLASLTRSTLGFGDALVAMPLLTLVIDVQVAAPLGILVSMTIAAVILGREWRAVQIGSASRLILSALVGLPPGIFILKNAPQQFVLGLLGLVLILYGLYSLLQPQIMQLKDEKSAYIFGFCAGLIGGAYNTSGPPIVVYGAMRRWSPGQFRTTIQSFFLFTGFFTMIGHIIGGLWTKDVLQLYAFSMPLVFVSILSGTWLSSRIPHDFFAKLVYIFLVIIGLVMLLRAV